MIGGKVIQIQQLPDRPGLSWINTYDAKDEPCAILVETETHAKIQLGDTLWWQQGSAYWTPADRSRTDVMLKKVGGSGVHHPLGREYEVKLDFEPLYKKWKQELADLKRVVRNTLPELSMVTERLSTGNYEGQADKVGLIYEALMESVR